MYADDVREISTYHKVKAVNFGFLHCYYYKVTLLYCFYQCLNKVHVLQLHGIITSKILSVITSKGFIRNSWLLFIAQLMDSASWDQSIQKEIKGSILINIPQQSSVHFSFTVKPVFWSHTSACSALNRLKGQQQMASLKKKCCSQTIPCTISDIKTWT